MLGIFGLDRAGQDTGQCHEQAAALSLSLHVLATHVREINDARPSPLVCGLERPRILILVLV